jgi:hypothetical protein
MPPSARPPCRLSPANSVRHPRTSRRVGSLCGAEITGPRLRLEESARNFQRHTNPNTGKSPLARLVVPPAKLRREAPAGAGRKWKIK